jgi:lysophosphatidate acyltransferase
MSGEALDSAVNTDRIIVLDPIPTTGLTIEDVDELTRSTRELMLKEVIALTKRARNEPIAVPVSSGSRVITSSGRDTSRS